MVPLLENINFGHYKISPPRPEEVMLFVMVKVCLHYQIVLFLRALKYYFLLVYSIAFSSGVKTLEDLMIPGRKVQILIGAWA